MIQIVTLLLVFALPFFIGPMAPSFFETPKIYGIYLLVELFTIISIFKINVKQKVIFSKSEYLLMGLFAFVTLQFILHPEPFAFFGNEFRKQGVFLLWHLILFALLSTYNNQPTTKIPSRITLIALLLSTFFLGTSVDERAVGVFGEPNSLGMYATFLWPLTGSFWFAVPAGLIILLSGSRSAFISFAIQCFFLIVTKKFHISIKKSLLISFVLLALTFTLPFFEREAEYQNRPLIWKTAFTAGIQKPLFGWGFGNTEKAIKVGALQLKNPLRYEYVDSSHNILLDWFVQGGIVGVTFLTMIIGLTMDNLLRPIKNFKHDIRISYLLSFLSLIAGLLFNPVSVAILIPFWWLIGVSNQKQVE